MQHKNLVKVLKYPTMEELDNLPRDLEYLFIYYFGYAVSYETMKLPPLNLPLTLKKIIILGNDLDDSHFEVDFFRNAKLPFGLEIETAIRMKYDVRNDDEECYNYNKCCWKLRARNNKWMAKFTLIVNEVNELQNLRFFKKNVSGEKYYCLQLR